MTIAGRNQQKELRLSAVAQLAYALAPERLGALKQFLAQQVPHTLPAKVAYEIILQSYLFFGYAQAIEAAKVYASLGFDLPTDSLPELETLTRAEMVRRGELLCSKIYAPNFKRLVANMKAVSPELADWMVVEGYGRVLSRNGPTEIERELASIVFLVCSGHPVQLFSHVRGAKNLGVSQLQLQSATMPLGFSATQRELLARTIAKVFGE